MTKIVLGIIATNEELPLSKFLPGLSEAFKGEVIGIDYESTDKTPELFKEYCKYSITEPWPRDFSKAKNQLIDMAERAGYEWMLLLDADENMDVKKIPLLEKYVEQNPYSVYYFPRISFQTEKIIEGSIDGFPDLQSRLFKLNSDYKYQEKTHCQLCVDGENVFELGEGCVIPDIFIYHHGGLKGPESVLLKVLEREAMAKGLPPVKDISQSGIVDVESWYMDLAAKPLKLLCED